MTNKYDIALCNGDGWVLDSTRIPEDGSEMSTETLAGIMDNIDEIVEKLKAEYRRLDKILASRDGGC